MAIRDDIDSRQASDQQRASCRLRYLTFAMLLLCGFVNAASLSVSTKADRSAAVDAQGVTLGVGNVYLFAVNETGLRQVEFYLDPPLSNPTPTRVDDAAPFDFAGTASSGNALPFSTAGLAVGPHSLRAVFTYQSAPSQTVNVSFTVRTGAQQSLHNTLLSQNSGRTNATALSGSTLGTSPAYIFLEPVADVRRVDFYLDNATKATSSETIAPLDFAHTASNNAAIAWNPSVLADGPHTIRAVVTPTSGSPETVTSAFTVSTTTGGGDGGGGDGDGGGSGGSSGGGDEDRCAPVVCQQIKVALPFNLEFNADAGHLVDGLGVGTGFTYVLPSSHAASYTKENLFIDPTRGQLGIKTTAGIATSSVNTHTNMLGVGFTGQAQVARISTRIVSPPKGTGKWEQAGLWFGYDQDHYFKAAYESSPSGNAVEFYEEVGGKTVKTTSVAVTGAAPASVSFDLIIDPYNQLVSAYYAIGSNDTAPLGKPFSAPPEFFSFDAAGIDPEIGTRSFAGIFATNRNSSKSLTYWFDSFSITSTGTGTPSGQVTFSRLSHSVSYPTNMVWGPDNRLYVTEMYGNIHALTYDSNLNVIQDQKITSLVTASGKRLTLGITVDPASTPSNVILWVSSSSPSTSVGQLNSGMVTRLSGPGFATVQNVITGLPRAISNHAPNSLHFGSDGRLYLAIGGNTGTGAPADEPNEFGDRPEQWLSAAIVVADVNAANFDGSCAPTGIYDPAPCSVVTYATGLRNAYDFVFHSNGHMYATDNGLGVTGAYPPKPQPPCFGVGDATEWNHGGDNPGTQPDLLHLIEEGKYYGHPNPARSQCVFRDGSYQHVAPLPNYVPPFASLGDHMSADGITEYQGTAVCGAHGSLLVANYSLGQSITQVTLSPGGLSVQSSKTLVSGLAGPLAITTNPGGDIFVSELNSNVVTALRYAGPACSN